MNVLGMKIAARREKAEIFFESSIPARYILGYQLLALPKFNKAWSPKIQQRYGLQQNVYESYQKKFRANLAQPQSILGEFQSL